MKFAILGADRSVVELASAALDSGHQLVWLCELGTSLEAEQLRALAGSARVADSWELLLDHQQADALIVARASDEEHRTQQLRTLVQVGRPLLVSHPVVDSMLVYYELDMIRRDTQCTMMAYLPLRLHPVIQSLHPGATDGSAAPFVLEQLVFERFLTTRSKAAVQEQLARDIDLVRAICGEITRVTAVAPTAEDTGYASLGVQMTTGHEVVARWSVLPAGLGDAARLTLIGPDASQVISWTDPAKQWVIERRAGDSASREELPAWNPAAAVIKRFAAAVEGETVQSDWVDAARSSELCDAIERSVRKGRTIDLYYEDFTEESTFKGTMASVGCGLLILGLLAILALAIAEQAGLIVRVWPQVLLGVLGLFLSLQLLMLLFPSKQHYATDSRTTVTK